MQILSIKDDGMTVPNTFLYRVNYGEFSILIESTTELSEADCIIMATQRLQNQEVVQEPLPPIIPEEQIPDLQNNGY